MTSRNLLIIDDDRGMRSAVADAAATLGFEVTSCENAAVLTDHDFERADVILLDLMMPGMDGIEVLRRMAGGTRASIILMSGLQEKLLRSARQIADAKGLRVTATLKKPFRIAQLRESLQAASGQAESQAMPATQPPTEQPLTPRDFARALARDELDIHFQPQVRFSDGAWCGVEALVRWQHAERGLLSPAVFMTMAESPEFVLPFTERVLRKALTNARALSGASGYTGTVSINLPPSAMTNVSLTERLVELVEEQHFDRSRLMIELTESSMPADLNVALDIVTRLRMRGIRLSIDDFGIGWSTFERLESAPFDELKIDKAFVRHAERDASAQAIVRNATRLGHDLRMVVVAEGVEDEHHFQLLRDWGCDLAQGYFIGRPMAWQDLCRWAEQRRQAGFGDAGPRAATQLAQLAGGPGLLMTVPGGITVPGSLEASDTVPMPYRPDH